MTTEPVGLVVLCSLPARVARTPWPWPPEDNSIEGDVQLSRLDRPPIGAKSQTAQLCY